MDTDRPGLVNAAEAAEQRANPVRTSGQCRRAPMHGPGRRRHRAEFLDPASGDEIEPPAGDGLVVLDATAASIIPWGGAAAGMGHAASPQRRGCSVWAAATKSRRGGGSPATSAWARPASSS